MPGGFNPFSIINAAKQSGGGMDPVTAAALISGLASLGGGFLSDEEEVAEKEGKANRKLERQLELFKIIMDAAKVESQNAYDANRAKVMAPLAAKRMESRLSPSPVTEARVGAMGRVGGADPGVGSLVTSSFEQFRQERAQAKQMAGNITPESLYTPQVNPLDAVKREAPEAYMDARGMQKYENKPGDGLDDIEVAMLNKAVAEGRNPADIGKMLATFRRKEVQGGVSNG